MIKQAMILTAGLGTRAKPFSERLAKPLFPIMGIEVLAFTVAQLVQQGFHRIAFNVHAHALQMFTFAAFLKKAYPHVAFFLSDETQVLMGSAGGIRLAAERFFDKAHPLLIVNGDVLCEPPLDALFSLFHARARSQPGQGVFWCRPFCATTPLYAQVHVDPETQSIQALGPFASEGLMFTGVYVLDLQVLEGLSLVSPSDAVKMVFQPLIAENRLAAWVQEGFWQDLGSAVLWFEAHLAVLKALEQKSLPASMARLIEENNIRVAHQVWVSKLFTGDLVALEKKFVGPLYWGTVPGQAPLPWNLDAQDKPFGFGPRLIVYGKPGNFPSDYLADCLVYDQQEVSFANTGS
jgi:NDP-sugar pyrophosphorylase family protein